MESNHVQTEGGKTMRNGQIDFTEGWRANTYRLRMGRRREMVRLTSRRDGDQPRTDWGLEDDEKWSDQLHGAKSNRVHPEDGQTTRSGQIDFTEGQRATTYKLKMGRRREKVRSPSEGWRAHIHPEDWYTTWNGQIDFTGDGEQPRTGWGWAGDAKWSDRPHGGMETNHVQTEEDDGQMTQKGQFDFTERCRPTTYKLTKNG